MYVFISYAGEEGLEYAQILNSILENGGHTTYLHIRDTTINERLYSKIGDALDSCRIVAIIITDSSHKSSEQEREYNAACSLNKESGIIKDGVSLRKFTLIRSKPYIRFNDDNINDKMKEFLSSINRIPEDMGVSVSTEEGEIK